MEVVLDKSLINGPFSGTPCLTLEGSRVAVGNISPSVGSYGTMADLAGHRQKLLPSSSSDSVAHVIWAGDGSGVRNHSTESTKGPSFGRTMPMFDHWFHKDLFLEFFFQVFIPCCSFRNSSGWRLHHGPMLISC